MDEQREHIQGTALVHVDPVADARIRALGEEVQGLVRHAASAVIHTDDDVKTATADISLVTGLKKAFEDRRREYVVPLNDYIKDINAAFRTYTDPLDQADKTYRGKVLAYRAEVERQRQEQERINRLREEAARAEMALRDELTEPVALVEVTAPPPPRYRTDAGTLGTGRAWKFEVVDFAALPDEYKVADLVKIRKVIIAGVTIRGVRAWQEETLRVTPPQR